MSPTAKAESLDVLNDIIPTPVVEQPVAAATNAETELPTAPAGPVSIAPEGQLSQVFELTPSDVAIPSNETSTVVQTEPAMVPISSVNSTNPVPEMVSVGLNQNTAVNYQKTNQKNGRSGGVLRYILWMFILILGVVAVILGAYLANLIQIPFLNSIFGR